MFSLKFKSVVFYLKLITCFLLPRPFDTYKCFLKYSLAIIFVVYSCMMRFQRLKSNVGAKENRPFPNCLLPLSQSEALYKVFHMKMSFICM